MVSCLHCVTLRYFEGLKILHSWATGFILATWKLDSSRVTSPSDQRYLPLIELVFRILVAWKCESLSVSLSAKRERKNGIFVAYNAIPCTSWNHWLKVYRLFVSLFSNFDDRRWTLYTYLSSINRASLRRPQRLFDLLMAWK